MEKIAVVLAGGRGERLFPLSTDEKPKQFLNLYNEHSLLINTINRLLEVFDRENIYVVGRKKDEIILHNLLENKINTEHILLEQASLNTSFGILYSIYKIKERYEDATINVFSSDHYIKDGDRYIEILKDVNEKIDEHILLFGVTPTHPSTQFGYIKLENSCDQIKKVEAFIQKPDLEKAKEYLKNNYLWNSGIYIFNLKVMLNEFNKYLPDYIKYFDEYFIYNAISMDELTTFLTPISIDKAILEKSSIVECLEFDAGWMDVGTYSNLDLILEHDKNNNTISKNVKTLDSSNCMVIGNTKKITLIDVDDLVISFGEDEILIMKKNSDISKINNYNSNI